MQSSMMVKTEDGEVNSTHPWMSGDGRFLAADLAPARGRGGAVRHARDSRPHDVFVASSSGTD